MDLQTTLRNVLGPLLDEIICFDELRRNIPYTVITSHEWNRMLDSESPLGSILWKLYTSSQKLPLFWESRALRLTLGTMEGLKFLRIVRENNELERHFIGESELRISSTSIYPQQEDLRKLGRNFEIPSSDEDQRRRFEDLRRKLVCYFDRENRKQFHNALIYTGLPRVVTPSESTAFSGSGFLKHILRVECGLNDSQFVQAFEAISEKTDEHDHITAKIRELLTEDKSKAIATDLDQSEKTTQLYEYLESKLEDYKVDIQALVSVLNSNEIDDVEDLKLASDVGGWDDIAGLKIKQKWALKQVFAK